MKTIERHHEQAVEVLKEVFGDKDIVGVEIGTNAGDLTKTLLRDIPNLRKLITVDPWKYFEGEQFEAGNTQEYHEQQKAAALHKIKEFGSRVKVVQETSDRAFEVILNVGVKIDFIWIDGHHTKEQVEKDIASGLEVLLKGKKTPTLIGGHDYGLVVEVSQVVDKVFINHQIQTGGDFTWWVTYE